MIKKQFSELMNYNPYIDQLYVFDKEQGIKSLKDKIRDGGYDHIVDIHKNIRSTILKYSSNASSSTYPKYIFRRTLLVTFGVNLYKNVKPVYLRYFESVNNFGVGYDHRGTEVFFTPKHLVNVTIALANAGCRINGKMVIICPGASYSNKQWIPERFAQLGDRLNEKGYIVCFHGGKNDIDLCESIIRLMKKNSVSFAGQFSLLESAAFLKMASLAITNDSGMMHLAQSQKTPVVAIFGPTTKELGYFPLPDRSIVVEKMVSCRPCTHNGLNYCPKKHFRCMMEIQVDDIEVAAMMFLTNSL